MLILSIGLAIGGYSLILNDDASDLTANYIPKDVNDSSQGNISLDYNDNSNNNPKVIKDILGNDLNETNSVSPIQVTDSNENNEVPTKSGNVGYAAYQLNDNSYHSYPVDSSNYDLAGSVNKSEYVLSPNYNEHIYVKIGQDFTDKYGFCVADGGFIPLGNITKQIPADKICNLDCSIGDCYFDLSSPYIYDYGNVSYYLEHGEFGSDVLIKQEQYIKDYYNTNYRKLEGHEDIYLNVHQDFTDKYVLCMDCGRYVPLGNVTTPLRDIMICDYPIQFGMINYINLEDRCVITPEEAYASWDSYLENLYSNPDYHPIHSDEPDYGGDYVEEPNDINAPSDELPQEDADVENPQIVVDLINVG